MFANPEILTETQFAGNRLFDWGLALLVTAAVYFILLGALCLLRSKLTQAGRKSMLLELTADMLDAKKRLCLFLIALYPGSRCLGLTPDWQDLFSFLLSIGLILQFGFWASRFTVAYAKHYSAVRRDSDPGAVTTFGAISFMVRLAIWSVVLLLFIDNLGVEVTTLLAGLGVGGVAIALAVQNILGDLFASLSIVLDKPFVVDDFIIVDDLLGVVERIGIKTTRVRSLSGEQLIFSNADLLSARIRNFKRMEERRVAFGFGVLYQTKPEKLEAIPARIKTIIESLDDLRFDRAHFKGFGESSYDFEVVYYIGTPDYNAYMDAQQAINLGICRAFDEMGVEFAYPTRTLYMNQVS